MNKTYIKNYVRKLQLINKNQRNYDNLLSKLRVIRNRLSVQFFLCNLNNYKSSLLRRRVSEKTFYFKLYINSF